MIVGLLHPGEMGSAVGDVLVDAGHKVVWASAGRSDATRQRARRFRDVVTVESVAGEAELILSVCPPHAALDVARATGDFDGLYADGHIAYDANGAQSTITTGGWDFTHNTVFDGGTPHADIDFTS